MPIYIRSVEKAPKSLKRNVLIRPGIHVFTCFRYSKSVKAGALQGNGRLRGKCVVYERGVNRGGEDVAPTQNTVANARCGSRVISGVHPVVTVMKPIGRGRLRIPVFPK
jgi:hypothetical protein